MAGEIWSKMHLILMLVIETVLGKASSSEHNIDFGQRTPPCHISYHRNGNHQADHGSINTRIEVYISSPWMRHKGCILDKQQFKENKRKHLKHNSPGHCSLFCGSSGYFGLRITVCICLEARDFKYNPSPNCHNPCPYPELLATCGSSVEYYFDVYQHGKGFKEDPNYDHNVEEEDDVNKNCMVVQWDDDNVTFKAVSCFENHTLYCPVHGKGFHLLGQTTKATASSHKDCPNFGDDWKRKNEQLPENISMWTSFIRSRIRIVKKCTILQKMPFHSKCLLEKVHSWSTVLLSLNFTDGTHAFISLSCDITRKSICQCDAVKYSDYRETDDHITHLEIGHSTQRQTGNEYNQSTTIQIGSENTFKLAKISEGWKTTMAPWMESTRESLVELSTSRNDTTNNPYHFDNSVFALQIGIAIGVSCFVIFIAILACCIYRPKRRTYTFPISRSEENIVMAVEGNSHQPTAVLADNYSDPVDKASTLNEVEGPRFCASKPFQNTNYQKTENVEYQHLNFTMRSETATRFADNSEYDHVRANVVSVFDQPWDTATSKVNKLFSQISKSVVQKGQNMRKSLIKRRESRSGSPKLKCRASDYCDAWKTQLNKHQFVFDSDVDNQSDISIDIATPTVDSNKDKPKLRRTDSAFPVLPYSERIHVKSTHIYDEPDERRMSLRERLLHMISIRPIKMPFGIELDLRASRSKSKIYSVATSLDEIDESVA